MRLVLASSSKSRLRLLEYIGYIPAIVHPADIDETPLSKELPKQLAERLARAKASVIQRLYPSDIVLGADTVCCTGRTILPKALSEEDVRFCISKISGRRHRIYTSVCGIYKDRVSVKTVCSLIKFKKLSSEETKSFVESGSWYGNAGGYTLHGFAAAFISWISGSDSNIIGLPLHETYNILAGLGISPSAEILSRQGAAQPELYS